MSGSLTKELLRKALELPPLPEYAKPIFVVPDAWYEMAKQEFGDSVELVKASDTYLPVNST